MFQLWGCLLLALLSFSISPGKNTAFASSLTFEWFLGSHSCETCQQCQYKPTGSCQRESALVDDAAWIRELSRAKFTGQLHWIASHWQYLLIIHSIDDSHWRLLEEKRKLLCATRTFLCATRTFLCATRIILWCVDFSNNFDNAWSSKWLQTVIPGVDEV